MNTDPIILIVVLALLLVPVGYFHWHRRRRAARSNAVPPVEMTAILIDGQPHPASVAEYVAAYGKLAAWKQSVLTQVSLLRDEEKQIPSDLRRTENEINRELLSLIQQARQVIRS